MGTARQPKSEPHHHTHIKSYLEDLVDPARRRNLGATEAFCLWFDDLYAPEDNPASYHPGVFEKGLADWRNCFAESELLALQKFNEYFKSMSDAFDVDRKWEDIESDPAWLRLIAEAQIALHSFR